MKTGASVKSAKTRSTKCQTVRRGKTIVVICPKEPRLKKKQGKKKKKKKK